MSIFGENLRELALPAPIERLLASRGCKTIGDVLNLPGEALTSAGISPVELGQIARVVERLRGRQRPNPEDLVRASNGDANKPLIEKTFSESTAAQVVQQPLPTGDDVGRTALLQATRRLQINRDANNHTYLIWQMDAELVPADARRVGQSELLRWLQREARQILDERGISCAEDSLGWDGPTLTLTFALPDSAVSAARRAVERW